MKKMILAISLIIINGIAGLQLLAQTQPDNFTENPGKEINMPGAMDFIPNEILVKFRDEFQVTPEGLIKQSSASKGVNSLLAGYSIEGAEKIFHSYKQTKNKLTVRTPSGSEMEVPSLHNIFRLVLVNSGERKNLPLDITEVLSELRKLPEVEFAEPNYLYSIGDFSAVSPVIVDAGCNTSDNKNDKDGSKGLLPDDPLFTQQWGIPAIKADEVWLTHTGDTSSVIAIVDTGVEWLHPDLAENIWTNHYDIPGNEKDDDNNGFIDDVRGWDFISNDNNPTDDNSHGTHCAGIAAAEGDNGIGIAGVNWKAKIMPVKVFQSSGWADAANISQGINYASSNGADVISMSFGSYAHSLTMEAALANAYATSVLIAAAGNDGLCIGPGRCPDFRMGQPVFPAAISFVLGVQAPPLPPIGFSNYDQDGAVFSAYEEQYNYELSAPGTAIISCIPGGSYRSYSGTSMAAPYAAGAVSLFKELFPTYSQELLWGTIINTSGDYLDIYQAVQAEPVPVLNVFKFVLSDTISGGDGDWKADAGETIQMEVFVRNTWGVSDSIYVGLEFDEFEDPTTATILQQECYIGSVGSYSSLSNFSDPLEISLNPDLAHGREIRFRLLTWKGKAKEYLTSIPVKVRVEHGTELIGVIDDTLRLTADKFWLVSNSFKLGSNGVLIINPGSTIKIEKTITNYGKIIAVGTSDSLIYIIGPSGINGGSKTFSYTDFSGIQYANIITGGENTYANCSFHDCTIYGVNLVTAFSQGNHHFTNCTFNNFPYGNGRIFDYLTGYSVEYSNFNNIHIGITYWSPSEPFRYCNFSNSSNIPFSNIDIELCNLFTDISYTVPEGTFWDIPLNYWGTTDSLSIALKIQDFWDNSALSLISYSDILNKPDSLAHGCVWKVVVNGFDTQDEFTQLDPLGVGRHKFDVYFNRPMDIAFTPTVSMGVREPFTQISINEDASWSSDSLVYTVYKTLGLTDADGINRIKVTGGKDTEGFDLVPENERFNVNIQSQGSLSTEFMATPGMGKVDLEWSSPDEFVDDLLGYNMYRYTFINDSTTTDTILVNSSMIADTVYTDFNVVPGTRYFYTYKTVRTDFTESSFSNIVAATPYTAEKGDANGDLSVNVSDIISTVSYILMNYPQPFIFEAADMNTDGVINVLDVTSIVHRILNPTKSESGVRATGTAKLIVRNDTLFIWSDVPIAGIQFVMHNVSVNDYSVLKTLDGFERIALQRADSLFFLAYSMTGKTVGPGEIPIIKLNSKSVLINGLILSDSKGASINSVITDIGGPSVISLPSDSFFELDQNYPNPFKSETTIIFRLIKPVDEVSFKVYNASGKIVDEIIFSDPLEGETRFTWRPRTGNGVYLGKMSVRTSGSTLAEKTIKMIIR